MRGLNQHLEFQLKLARGRRGEGSQDGSYSGSNKAIADYDGQVPDYVPDIGSMIPIERAE